MSEQRESVVEFRHVDFEIDGVKILRGLDLAVSRGETLVLQDMETRQRNLLHDEDLARITVPTLVLWTSHDPTAPPAEGERIAGVIPGAEFVVMQDCGHWPQFEKPEEFNSIHLDFLNRAVKGVS